MGDFKIKNFRAKPPQKTINFADENTYKHYLETKYFPTFFDQPWQPDIGKTKEKNIRCDTSRSIIDYYGLKESIPTYVEVKNDRIRQRYLMQILRYYCECNEENTTFNLYVICTKKIRPHREKVLKKLDIKIIDYKETNPEELIYWM